VVSRHDRRGEPLPDGYTRTSQDDATFRTFGGVRYSVPAISARRGRRAPSRSGSRSGCINTAGEKVFPESRGDPQLHPDVRTPWSLRAE